MQTMIIISTQSSSGPNSRASRARTQGFIYIIIYLFCGTRMRIHVVVGSQLQVGWPYKQRHQLGAGRFQYPAIFGAELACVHFYTCVGISIYQLTCGTRVRMRTVTLSLDRSSRQAAPTCSATSSAPVGSSTQPSSGPSSRAFPSMPAWVSSHQDERERALLPITVVWKKVLAYISYLLNFLYFKLT